MTLKEFSKIFSVLAVQLRATDVDELTIRAYHLALEDLDVELVAMAAQRLGKGATLNEQGEAWFPKAPEWRALVGKIEGERTAALKAVLRKLPSPLCAVCNDTGWKATATQDTRYSLCECLKLRRLEILGRRPMPQLPERASA